MTTYWQTVGCNRKKKKRKNRRKEKAGGGNQEGEDVYERSKVAEDPGPVKLSNKKNEVKIMKK